MATLHGKDLAWTDLGESDKSQFLCRLRAKRDDDLSKPSTYTKKRQAKKTVNDMISDTLTPEEVAMAKTLGMTKKELKAALDL